MPAIHSGIQLFVHYTRFSDLVNISCNSASATAYVVVFSLLGRNIFGLATM